MFENPSIQISVCRGGYAVACAMWADDVEDVPLSGGAFVATSADEVLRLVRLYIEQADAYGKAGEASDAVEDAIKRK